MNKRAADRDRIKAEIERRAAAMGKSGHHQWNAVLKELQDLLGFIEEMAPEGKTDWPKPEVQLRATVFAAPVRGTVLSEEKRDQLIHRLIEKYDGVQDNGLGGGVVIIPLYEDDNQDNLFCQLWLYEWG